MLISICGTPCSGKTTSSKILKKNGWDVINDRDLIRHLSLFEEVDENSGELIVDTDEIREGFTRWAADNGPRSVLEGHLSYLAPFDICFILRLDPLELKNRLSSRGYTEVKVKDNLESEALGYVTIKAIEEWEERTGISISEGYVASNPLVLERDITGMSPDDIGKWFLSVIDSTGGERLNSISLYRPGSIDFLEAYSKWF